MNRKPDLDAMSIEEMWQLHEAINRILSVRLTSEKRELEKRLAQLQRDKSPSSPRPGLSINRERPRRKYPEVLPKYQNPNKPSEIWSGRGKQPRWFSAALEAGRTLQDLAIVKAVLGPTSVSGLG